MIIPRPTNIEPDEPELRGATWIKWFLDVPNWVCAHCQATMFGRMEFCVYCKMKLGKDTPRPNDYTSVRGQFNTER